MSREEPDSEEIEEIEHVEDSEEFIQSRRLRDIFETRKEVREQRLIAKKHSLSNGHDSEQVGAKLYRIAVENYLTELRPLFLTDELGKRYWFEADFGTVVVEPPVYEKPRRGKTDLYLEQSETSKPLKVRNNIQPKEIKLTGLNCLFELSQPLQVEFGVRAGGVGKFGIGSKGGTAQTAVSEALIPFDKLDLILNAANEYLSKRGIELDPEEGLPEDELKL